MKFLVFDFDICYRVNVVQIPSDSCKNFGFSNATWCSERNDSENC